jgi:uncharacterized BrkB/YihY/UPF0761 family membrane protein
MLVSISVITLLFAMMFKWLPDAAVDWYDVWLGAVITAVLFEMGKSAIGFYIGKQGLDSTYGAAASIIVVLIWVYYSSQIILMGAEVTHAFAKHRGSIRNRCPTPSAPPLRHLTFVREPRRIPVILSLEEIARLKSAKGNPAVRWFQTNCGEQPQPARRFCRSPQWEVSQI